MQRFARHFAALYFFLPLASACTSDRGESPAAGSDSSSVQAPVAQASPLALQDSLAVALYDLKREIWSRTSGFLLHEVAFPATREPGTVPELPDHELSPSGAADIPQAPPSSQRNRTTVAFSGRDIDDRGFDDWLRAAGFKLAPAGQPHDSTNAVTVGDSVTVQDVQAVALEMNNAGLRVRRIRRLSQGDPFKITLHYFPHLRGVPPLSVDQIRALRPATRADE